MARSAAAMATSAAAILFAIAGAAAAENGIVNGDFDENATGWTSPQGELAWDAAVDVDECADSGSAHLSAPELVNENWTATLASSGSCVPVTPDDVVSIRVRMKPGSAIAHTDFLLFVYSDDQCTTDEAERAMVGYGTLPLQWLDFQIGATILAGTGSVRLLVRLTDATASTFDAWFDSIYLGLDTPIFLDGFEPGYCRWLPNVIGG